MAREGIAVVLVLVAVRVMAREVVVVGRGYRCCSWCLRGGMSEARRRVHTGTDTVGVALVKGPCQYDGAYGIGGTLYTDGPYQSCCRSLV